MLSWPQHATLFDRFAHIVIDVSHAFVDSLPTKHTPRTLDALAHARAELAMMRALPPAQLARPVVVFNGYHGWWGLASTVRDALRAATGSNDIVCVSYAHRCSLAAAASDARRAIERHLGKAYATGDASFDAVGISMGGIIARMLATPGVDASDERTLSHARAGEKLNIARVFTLGTPHRGAMRAEHLPVDAAAQAMRASSPTTCALQRSVEAGLGPTLRCFAQTRDGVVGTRNCSPRGVRCERMPGPRFGSHFSSARNPVFLAAIVRELRDEAGTHEAKGSNN